MRLIRNLMHDPGNTVAVMILYGVIKLLNGIQYAKMGVYMMFGIKCYMHTDRKFGEKICYKVKD